MGKRKQEKHHRTNSLTILINNSIFIIKRYHYETVIDFYAIIVDTIS